MGHNFNDFNMNDGKILYVKYKLNISGITFIKPGKKQIFLLYLLATSFYSYFSDMCFVIQWFCNNVNTVFFI